MAKVVQQRRICRDLERGHLPQRHGGAGAKTGVEGLEGQLFSAGHVEHDDTFDQIARGQHEKIRDRCDTFSTASMATRIRPRSGGGQAPVGVHDDTNTPDGVGHGNVNQWEWEQQWWGGQFVLISFAANVFAHVVCGLWVVWLLWRNTEIEMML